MDAITASLATIPEREDALRNVVEALLPQVDHLLVYLNGYAAVPGFLHTAPGKLWLSGTPEQPDLGDAGKFYHSGFGPSGYRLVCDDDLHYPPDYAERTVAAIERYDRQAAVCYGGKRFDEMPVDSYYCDFTTNLRVFNDLDEDTEMHVPLTCVFAYHTDTIRFDVGRMTRPNMADIWCAMQCHEADVPVVALAHRGDWITHQDIDLSNSIYRQESRNDGYQTRIVNSIAWRAAA